MEHHESGNSAYGGSYVSYVFMFLGLRNVESVRVWILRESNQLKQGPQIPFSQKTEGPT